MTRAAAIIAVAALGLVLGHTATKAMANDIHRNIAAVEGW